MTRNVQTLLAHYHQWVLRAENPNPTWVSHYNDLRLVDACQDKVGLNEDQPNHPVQIGIVGPTQAGKSTLVNVLTHSGYAGVSARAGYTVHAQGFGINLSEEDIASIQTVLEPMVRVSPQQLDVELLDAYVLQPITAGLNAVVKQGVIWDSPDFDSIEARGYRGAVLYTLALADVLILMVSKDKYGDKSVWDMLNLMVPLNKPILVVINKLSERDSESVQRSFSERFAKHHPNHPALPLVALPYVDEPRPFTKEELKALSTGLSQAKKSIARNKMKPAIKEFVDAHWARWIQPAEQERDANTHWVNAVNTAVDDALKQYELRYLNDDSRNNVFNRALAELLNLLEIPGIAASLQKTRELVTWPARKILGFGIKAVRDKTMQAPPENLEIDVLKSVQTHVITTLQGVAVDAQHDFPEQAFWWRSLTQELRTKRNTINTNFDQAAVHYQNNFEPRIEAAAQRLYQQLETQPKLLNSLRAARATTDAAAVALAVKTGGLAATDLLVAPAMLSATTLLTESALGRYMTTIKAELKAEQSAEVYQQILEGVLSTALLKLPNSMVQDDLLGVNLAQIT